ncbi:MAG: response regulator [Parcubacteria group bacterium]|nr:response regulator [Parcubacteria group bacterium]
MNKYIFIIEDDPVIQKAYQLKFAKNNLPFKAVLDGQEAIDFVKNLKNEPPAVIILDLMLPRASGFQILSEIKKRDGWKDATVLVLSNLSQAADIEKVKALGIKKFLIKADTRIDEMIELVIKYYNEAKD